MSVPVSVFQFENDILAVFRRRPSSAISCVDLLTHLKRDAESWDNRAQAIRILTLLEGKEKLEWIPPPKAGDPSRWRYVKPRNEAQH